MRTDCRRAPMPQPIRDVAMKPEEERTEDESVLAFTLPDEALERAADASFSLGNCTDVRTCQAPNGPHP